MPSDAVLKIFRKLLTFPSQIPYKSIKKIFIIAAISLGLLNIVEWQLLYLPSVNGRYSKDNYNGFRNPSEQGLQYEDLTIEENGVILKGWFLKQQEPKNSPTVIFFHENAGNIGWRLLYLKEYYERVKCNLVVVAYRGYDESTGTTYQSGIQQDALAIANYVFNQINIDKTRVFAHGRSLGGAVATYACYKNQHQFKGLIIENTFTSVNDVVANMNPVFKFLSSFIFFNTWRTIDIIDKIEKPILFISSGRDELIPYNLMKTLQSKAINKEEFHIALGDHNTNWNVDRDLYFQRIADFQKNVLLLK